MRVLLKVVAVIIIVFILVSVGGLFYLTRGLDEGINLSLWGINSSALNDGIYNGEYKSGRWTNKLKITVENKKITYIDIIDDVTFVRPGVSDELFSRVIKKQSTDIDAVSEATVTSKAYLKSIENAINNN